ncbi:MAG: GNAT family N-acetyltransferase [Rhizobiaceae bacterium]|nr:GNAT family N-acetyltransferase [Rhizobiaceae bacterium]
MRLKQIATGKSEICREILEALPQWFGIEQARENYITQAVNLVMFACISKDSHIGFLTLRTHNNWNAEIHCMGVLPQQHRQGIGTLLINAAFEYSNARGIKFLTVKTLSEASKDKHYAQTRDFYLKTGFVPFEEFPDFWDDDNPCLMMIKPLDA